MTAPKPRPWLPGTSVEVLIAHPTDPNGAPTIYEATIVNGDFADARMQPRILVALRPDDRRWVDADSVRRVES